MKTRNLLVGLAVIAIAFGIGLGLAQTTKPTSPIVGAQGRYQMYQMDHYLGVAGASAPIRYTSVFRLDTQTNPNWRDQSSRGWGRPEWREDLLAKSRREPLSRMPTKRTIESSAIEDYIAQSHPDVKGECQYRLDHLDLLVWLELGNPANRRRCCITTELFEDDMWREQIEAAVAGLLSMS